MIPITYLIYAGLIAFALIFLGAAQSFPGALSPRDIGPAALPQGLAILMIVLIVADAIVSRHRARKMPISDALLAGAVIVIMGGAVWLAQHLGFFVVLPVALFVGLWLSGSRRLLANLLYSLLLPAALWYFFDQLLLIPLADF